MRHPPPCEKGRAFLQHFLDTVPEVATTANILVALILLSSQLKDRVSLAPQVSMCPPPRTALWGWKLQEKSTRADVTTFGVTKLGGQPPLLHTYQGAREPQGVEAEGFMSLFPLRGSWGSTQRSGSRRRNRGGSSGPSKGGWKRSGRGLRRGTTWLN